MLSEDQTLSLEAWMFRLDALALLESLPAAPYLVLLLLILNFSAMDFKGSLKGLSTRNHSESIWKC
jgi:hypothetical protein